MTVCFWGAMLSVVTVIEERPAPERPTQAQRSARTQELLLDATVACLVELGYANTSTTEIVRRAGVSRGAQVHHFPTKASLVAAAVRHVFDRQQMEFEAAIGAIPPEDRTFVTAIDHLWDIFAGPSFVASLELTVAGRTDPELQPVITQVLEDFDQSIRDSFTRLFPLQATDPLNYTLVSFAFSVLQGAAIYRGAGLVEKAEASIGVLRMLADPTTATTTADSEGASS